MMNFPNPEIRDSKQVREMFDRVAPTYDRLNALLSFNIEKRWRKTACKKLKPDDLVNVLDLATGTGPFALEIFQQAKRLQVLKNAIQVTGIDFSIEMLRCGIKNKLSNSVKNKESKNYQIVQADARDLPFEDGLFSAATMGFGIRNVEQPIRALREAYRVLRKGAPFLILEFSQSDSFFSRYIFKFYFHRILPMVGNWISQDKTAYTYLPESVKHFPPPQQFSTMIQEAGFQQVNFYPLTFGIVTLYHAVK